MQSSTYRIKQPIFLRIFILISIIIGLASFKKEDATYCYSSNHFRFLSTPCDMKLIRACTIADSILNCPKFWDSVRFNHKQRIANSHYTMKRLADTLQNYKGVTTLELDKNDDEGIITAGTDTANLTRIYKAGYEASVNDLAITIIHEWVHAVDFAINDGKLEFAHRGLQGRIFNNNTASYRIEYIANAFVK